MLRQIPHPTKSVGIRNDNTGALARRGEQECGGICHCRRRAGEVFVTPPQGKEHSEILKGRKLRIS